MVSVALKGRGVKPEVTISPENGLISFSNVVLGETTEKTFDITNISSFPVNFNFVNLAHGVENISK
jgi:hypothetical protein